MKIRQSLLDSIAIGASFACMIHCLAVPILLAALPAFAQIADIPESFHLIMLGVAVPTSALALVRGHRIHGAAIPVIFGALGILLLCIGAFWPNNESLETGLTVLGSLALATAHIGNWRRSEQKLYAA